MPFSYRGSEIPFSSDKHEETINLAKQAVALVPGLSGYIGMDILIAVEGCYLLEINPRLTTSYIGLRLVVNMNKEPEQFIDTTASKIDAGLEMVKKTAETITGVATGAIKIGELVTDIAEASNQQAQGIEQLSVAVNEIDSRGIHAGDSHRGLHAHGQRFLEPVFGVQSYGQVSLDPRQLPISLAFGDITQEPHHANRLA